MADVPPPLGTESLLEGASLNQIVVTGAAVLLLIWGAKKMYEGLLGRKLS